MISLSPVLFNYMSNIKFEFMVLLFASSILLLIIYSDLYGESAAKPCQQPAEPLSEDCSPQIATSAKDMQTDAATTSNGRIALQAMDFAEQLDIDLMMDDVAWLADDARQGRATGFPGEDAAAQWLSERYEKLQLQPFKQLGQSSYIHSFTFPFGEEYLQGENIVGVLPGGINADEFIVVSAHYDHLGIKEGEIYNGADDDASGVAVVLEMARLFSQSQMRPQKSIVFIAFSGEEIGHVGSGNFCYQMFLQRSTKKLTVLNLEMLGAIRETYINIWDQDNALTQPIVAAVVAASEQMNMPVLVSSGLDPGSDAPELLDCNIAATTMDAGGGDDFYDNHPHYHAPSDDPEHIDRQGFLKAAQVATIAIWRLANNDFR